MATIYDVAKRAQVSTYTVSSVLNRTAYVSPELTERVLQAVHELDYTINSLARGLQTRRTQTLGMLIPDIANPFYAKVVRGVENVCKRDGYSLILGNTNNSAEEQSRYLTVFRSKQVDGLLLFVAADTEADVEALLRKKVPVVFVGREPRDLRADAVTADNKLGTALAMKHLLRKGHRRIAILTGQASLTVSRDRVEAWQRCLRDAGLPAEPELACAGDWTADSGHRTMLALLQRPEPPTAIFVANFLMMTGVLRALREQGRRCPEEVEVVCADDSEWLDIFDPPISTILQPSFEMGTQAAELLLQRIAEPERPPKRIVLEPQLKVRASNPIIAGG